MDHKDLFSALDIRASHTDFTVKSSRTEDRRIQNIHTVGRCHYDDSFIYSKTIHLYKKLVQRLLSLIVAAAHTGSSLTGYRIDLINKDDARCMTLALFKKISYTGSTDTNKHLHEIGSGNGEKRNSGLSCNCLREKSFTCSRRAHKDHSFRDPGTYLGILLWGFQEIHHFLQILLLLLKTCNILERYFLIIRGRHPGSAFSKVHHLRIASAASRHLPVHHHKEKEKDRAGKHYRKYCSDHGAVLGYIADRRIDIMFFKKRLRFLYIGYVDCLLTV